jgi:hypothetical protein
MIDFGAASSVKLRRRCVFHVKQWAAAVAAIAALMNK